MNCLPEAISPCGEDPHRETFPLTFHRILDNAVQNNCAHICSWQPHGRSFRIHNRTLFEVEILLKRFGHKTQFASFQRQLNLYGFHRLTQKTDDQGSFYHCCFLRGRPDLLFFVRRARVKGTGVRRPADPLSEPRFMLFPPLPALEATNDQPSSVIDLTNQQECMEMKPPFTKDQTRTRPAVLSPPSSQPTLGVSTNPSPATVGLSDVAQWKEPNSLYKGENVTAACLSTSTVDKQQASIAPSCDEVLGSSNSTKKEAAQKMVLVAEKARSEDRSLGSQNDFDVGDVNLEITKDGILRQDRTTMESSLSGLFPVDIDRMLATNDWPFSFHSLEVGSFYDELISNGESIDLALAELPTEDTTFLTESAL